MFLSLYFGNFNRQYLSLVTSFVSKLFIYKCIKFVRKSPNWNMQHFKKKKIWNLLIVGTRFLIFSFFKSVLLFFVYT